MLYELYELVFPEPSKFTGLHFQRNHGTTVNLKDRNVRTYISAPKKALSVETVARDWGCQIYLLNFKGCFTRFVDCKCK